MGRAMAVFLAGDAEDLAEDPLGVFGDAGGDACPATTAGRGAGGVVVGRLIGGRDWTGACGCGGGRWWGLVDVGGGHGGG